MRLHRLAVTAFGPFRDRQEVDFDALSAPGLFLLTGDTGAGKSSVLDAVAYALYGRVAGARASATRLRSDHADIEQPTRVELELTLRGRRLRVTRSPEWHRPKRRGTGITKQPTQVRLERLVDGGWELVSNRADEAGHELTTLLGMNHAQFCQVVLLPQGDFAQFLRADAETRKQLLERLFGTERFSAVESWLVERRRQRGQELSAVEREVTANLARLAEVTGTDEEPPTPDDPTAAAAWAATHVAALDDALVQARAELETARVARAAADDTLTMQRALAERQERLASLERRSAALAASAFEIAAARAELKAARRSASLTVLITAVATAAEVASSARVRADDALQVAVRAGVEPGSAGLEQVEHDLRAEVTRLEPLFADEAALEARLAERDRAELAVAELESTLAAAQVWLAEVPDRMAALQHRRAELIALVQAEPAVRAEHDALGPRIEAARRRTSLLGELAEVADRRRLAIDGAQTARARWQDLRERRLRAMAGELAAALRADEPCPVCGGLDHPAPAEQAAEAALGAEREAEALDDLERADGMRERCNQDHVAAAAALHEATLAAGGEETPDALAARLADLVASLRSAARAGEDLAVADAEVNALDAETSTLRDRFTEATAEHARAAARAEQLRVAVVGLTQTLDRARGDDRSVQARLDRLAEAVEAVVIARDASAEAATAAADLAAQTERAERAAIDAGFDDLDAAADAVRDPSAVATLVAAIEAAEHEAVLVADGLADPDVVGTALDPPAQPVAAAEHVDACAAEVERASGRVGSLQDDAGAAVRLVAALDTCLRAHSPLHQAFTTADGLSRLAEGTTTENRLRMRLSYFVLSARLEQVAEAASERLLRMTDGRFSLAHTDDRAAGNQRSGLGLAVRDAWYGTTRDPSTLSGGESFMASLALALGLADVVVAEAGGAFMDTLFVDEGFGSLDEATLDAVLDVLDGLREGGRAVGLVSHVGELRQRIPTQLAVRRGRGGSTLTLSA